MTQAWPMLREWKQLEEAQERELAKAVAEALLAGQQDGQGLLREYLQRCGPNRDWFARACHRVVRGQGRTCPFQDDSRKCYSDELQDFMQQAYARLADLEYLANREQDVLDQGGQPRYVIRELYERYLASLEHPPEAKQTHQGPSRLWRMFIPRNKRTLQDYLPRQRQLKHEPEEAGADADPPAEEGEAKGDAPIDDAPEGIVRHRTVRRLARLLPQLKTERDPDVGRRRINCLVGRYYLGFSPKELQKLWNTIQLTVGEDAGEAAAGRDVSEVLNKWLDGINLDGHPKLLARMIRRCYLNPIHALAAASSRGDVRVIVKFAPRFQNANLAQLIRRDSSPRWWDFYLTSHGDLSDSELDAFEFNDRQKPLWGPLEPYKKLKIIFGIFRMTASETFAPDDEVESWHT